MAGPFDPQRWWPAPLLPREDGRQASLYFIIGVLAFLASLAMVAGIAAERAAEGWRGQLVGSATVIVRAAGLESPDAAAARATSAIAGVPGVTEARALDKSQADALLAPFIGPNALPPDLPTPRLVAVELDPKHPATAADLAHALKAEGVDAEVDDHSVWTRQIMRAGTTALWAGVLVFVLIVTALGAMIAFATRQGLAARADLAEVLHLAGATDAFIARLFQARFARMAGLSGAGGAIGAILAAGALRMFGGGQTLSTILPIAWTDLVAPVPVPFLAALVAAVTARLTAQAVLRRTP